MRKYLWIVLSAALAAFVYAQISAGQVLSNYAAALQAAKSLKVSLTVQKMDGAPVSYEMELAKPNLARIDTPSELIVADGENITRYSKGEKTYFVEPQSEGALKEILGQDAFGLWSAFFNPNAFDKVSAKSLGTVNRKGVKVNAIEATYGDGKKKVVYYVSTTDNLTRQGEVSYADGKSSDTLVINAKSVEVGNDVKNSRFVFNAPQGARQLTLEEMNAGKWLTDLEEAKKLAARTNRKIFVDFMATWCGPCKMLEAEVLNTDQFKAYSKKLVFLRIDVDAQQDVAKMYNITAMPTQMVLAADGSIVKSTVGYGGPGPFYQFLNSAL